MGYQQFWTLLWASCEIWSNNSVPVPAPVPRQASLKGEDLGLGCVRRRKRRKGCCFLLVERLRLWWWMDE